MVDFANCVVCLNVFCITSCEEIKFLDTDNILILKRHYMKYYVQLRKELLDHLEDLMTQDSLVGSTVSTRSRSKKGESVISRISSPSVKSAITEASKLSEVSKPKETAKTSEYYSPLDFYPTLRTNGQSNKVNGKIMQNLMVLII
jgi:hypothetical protein